jgi:hypothetical protein
MQAALQRSSRAHAKLVPCVDRDGRPHARRRRGVGQAEDAVRRVGHEVARLRERGGPLRARRIREGGALLLPRPRVEARDHVRQVGHRVAALVAARLCNRRGAKVRRGGRGGERRGGRSSPLLGSAAPRLRGARGGARERAAAVRRWAPCAGARAHRRGAGASLACAPYGKTFAPFSVAFGHQEFSYSGQRPGFVRPGPE